MCRQPVRRGPVVLAKLVRDPHLPAISDGATAGEAACVAGRGAWLQGQDWLLAARAVRLFDAAVQACPIPNRIRPKLPVATAAQLVVPSDRACPVAAMVTMRCGDVRVHCDLSILEEGPQRWDITVSTEDGDLFLADGGDCLSSGGPAVDSSGSATAPGGSLRLTGRRARLIDSGRSDFDLGPPALVDAALACRRVERAPSFPFAGVA